MIETAVVFSPSGYDLHWHEPPGRTGGSIPDSRSFWDVIWENRDYMAGIAHTHPWKGEAVASHTDVTTFAAIELGLHKRLVWPVVTLTDVTYYTWDSVMNIYIPWNDHSPISNNKGWSEIIEELRRRSLGD